MRNEELFFRPSGIEKLKKFLKKHNTSVVLEFFLLTS